MSGHTGGDRPPGRSRRAVLAGTATALTVPAAVTSRGASQEITFPAVISEPDRMGRRDLAGFMIHVGPTTDPAELTATESCEFADWPPETTLAYDATLINRKQSDTPETDTILYASDEAPIPAGALFLINTFTRCESEFIGVNIKQIGRFDVAGGNASDYGPVADVEEDERPTDRSDGSGAVGPGFGAATAVAGVLGGALLRLGGEE